MAHVGPMSSRGPEVMLRAQRHIAAHPRVVLVSQWHMGVPLKCDGMGVSRWHVGSQWHGGAHPNVLVVSQWHVGGLVAHGGPNGTWGSRWHLGVPVKDDGAGLSQ